MGHRLSAMGESGSNRGCASSGWCRARGRSRASHELRREIHSRLQLIENWNSGNTVIFYGKVGDFSAADLHEFEAKLCQ